MKTMHAPKEQLEWVAVGDKVYLKQIISSTVWKSEYTPILYM